MTTLTNVVTDRAPRRRLRGRLRAFRGARALALPLLILLIWQVVQARAVVPTNLLPTPSSVLETIGTLASTGELAEHIAITSWRVLQGFLLGAVAATVLGSITGVSRTARELIDPLLQSLRSIPSLAWVPLFILWLGIYEPSKVALIAVGAFFPVYLSLTQGLLDVDRKLVEVGRMVGFNRLDLVRRILIPAALPAYVTGLRGGLGLAWMFVVAAEVMGASKGLGFLLVDGQQTGRASLILASILLFALLGKLTDGLLSLLSQRLLQWQDSHSLQAA
ncbi:ABC transporter permease [Vulcanococcus limneticus]|uniref:ABC transporter permease n=1 Tax=Vulcanococcus limneticus TaxID=2170428 RepID=UPI00398C1378